MYKMYCRLEKNWWNVRNIIILPQILLSDYSEFLSISEIKIFSLIFSKNQIHVQSSLFLCTHLYSMITRRLNWTLTGDQDKGLFISKGWYSLCLSSKLEGYISAEQTPFNEMRRKIHVHVHSYFTMHFDFKQLQWKTIWKNENLDGSQIFGTKRDTRKITKTHCRGGL